MQGREDEEVPGASNGRVDDLQAKIVQIPKEDNEQAEHIIIPDKVLSFVQFSPLIDLIDVQEIGSGSN